MRGEMYETRRKLLVLLKKRGSLSSEELSRELGITSVAVRKHLVELEKDGLLITYLERRPVGRPRHIYSLTDLAEGLFPTAYPELAIDLLDSIQELHGEEEVRRLLKLRTERLVEKYASRVKGKGFVEKAKVLAKLHEEAGFLNDWEQHEDEFVLKEYSCSLYQVAKKHPAVCECEMELLTRLLDAEIVPLASQAKGDRICHYVLRAKGA